MYDGVMEMETAMETIFLSLTSIAMLIVISVDAKRKRREFLNHASA